MDDMISRQAAVDAMKKQREELLKGLDKNSNVYGIISASTGIAICTVGQLPSAQPEPISEEYAKAVRNWLVNYQVKCAELQGRYTPYEVLGWIVSDWRKENGIW